MNNKKLLTFALTAALVISIAGCSGQPLTTRERGR
jgi:hypothetical protein